jgi:hypothetical protein
MHSYVKATLRFIRGIVGLNFSNLDSKKIIQAQFTVIQSSNIFFKKFEITNIAPAAKNNKANLPLVFSKNNEIMTRI